MRLRGQRVEVTGAGAPLTGRLVNVEFRKETDKNGNSSEDHYFLIVETDSRRAAHGGNHGFGFGANARRIAPKEFARISRSLARRRTSRCGT